MTTQTAHDLMSQYMDALLANGDFGRFLSDDVLWTTTETGDEIRGRDAVVGFITALHSQLFDAHVEVRNLVSTDGTALLEADFVGTHTGEFAGIAPTGASVRIPYAVVYDLAGGEITALRVYLPLSGLIGRLQEAAAASSTSSS
jgi:predicted ester cyclase